MYLDLPIVVLTHAHCNVLGVFVPNKLGGGDWQIVVQKEAHAQ
jgi:hypothetical protein